MGSNVWVRLAAILVLVGFSAACDEGTSPAAEFDAQETAQAVEDMLTAVNTDELDEAFGSLQAAGFLFGTSAAMLRDHPVELDVDGLGIAGDLGAVAVIPQEYLGATFEWDETQGSYVDSGATGAPSDGVRVIYYEIDPSTGTPVTPLSPLGHVDIRDTSTMEADRLEIVVINTTGSADLTLADYALEVSFSFTQSSLSYDVSAIGYLSNGSDQLNFDLSQDLLASETSATINQSFSLDLEGTGKSMSYTATITGDTGSGGSAETVTAEATITNGTDTVVLTIDLDGNTLSGQITKNGVVVVQLGGTGDNPTFTDADGNELTDAQVAALDNLWAGLGTMFTFVSKMFSFATI